MLTFEWEGQVRKAAATIRSIRAGKNRPDFDKKAAVTEAVIKDFRRRGTIYHDGTAGYVFLRDSHQLLRLERGHELLEVELLG